MKKLLIITKCLSSDDGLGRYSAGLIEHLRKIYKLIIFSSDLSGIEEKYLRDKNIEFHKIPRVKIFWRLSYNFLYSWKLLKFFRKADFIHSFSDYPQCLLPFWMPFLKKPIFVTIHGTYGILPLYNFKSRFFLKRVYRKASKIFCVSSFTEKEILKRVKLHNTIAISNGVDYEKFSRSGLRQISTQKNANTKLVLGVGVLKQRKGYHISILAIAKVKEKYPELKYYIVGNQSDKNYFNELKNLVRKHDLEKNVVFLKNISDEELIKLYYSADLLLLTSIYIKNNFEGFGQVYLEASACGKPVIGTYGCGAEDAIKDGVTGFLVPQNDIEKTFETVLKILDNQDLAKKLGENGKKRAQQMNWENIAKKYIETYENIISNR